MRYSHLISCIAGIASSSGCTLEEPKGAAPEERATGYDFPMMDAETTPDDLVHDPIERPAREHCEAVPPNALRNGNFEHQPIHACGWETFDAADWGIVAAPYCYKKRPGCSFYLATEVWGDHWVAQFYQRVSLACGAIYRLSFEAKAAGVSRPLAVAVLGGGPLRNAEGGFDLGAGIVLELTTEWTTHEFDFVAIEQADNSVVDFGIGGADTGLYLDNVALVRMAPPELGPTSARAAEESPCLTP